MKVFLLKDVEKVGLSGEMITVADGFAQNFLLPRTLAVEVTPANQASFARRTRVIEKRQEVIESNTSMLAERIKATTIVIKKKMHDDDKLYCSIGEVEIADALAQKGISVSKNQILIGKAIKKAGLHTITIKLSSRLQPTCVVKIVSEAE